MSGGSYSEGNNPTNINLEKLFSSIGYNLNIPNEDLFSTNFIPYYRTSKSITGGNSSDWTTPEIKSFFKELVDILQPEVILCLGKTTFIDVYSSLSDNVTPQKLKGSYNAVIENGHKLVSNIAIFPLAHCGSFGTGNRNKSLSNKSLDLQLKDWGAIKKYLEQKNTSTTL